MTQRAPAGSYLGFSQVAGDAQQRFDALEPISPGESGAARWPMRAAWERAMPRWRGKP
jgi:hypothetical protein